MIPKIIHLCWLSGEPYPDKIAKCISTWQKYLPDYEIMIWDTSRFDVKSTIWTSQAYAVRKYAFVADYIRFFAVYNFGGIYLDSDVEVLKPFNSLLNLPYFIGEECLGTHLEVAAFGAEKGTQWVKDALDYYTDRPFIKPDGTFDTTISPKIMEAVLFSKYKKVNIKTPNTFSYEKNDICVFPNWMLCGRKWLNGGKGKIVYDVNEGTFCIHHFAHTWAEFPGGPLHKLYFRITGKDWYMHYFGNFELYRK